MPKLRRRRRLGDVFAVLHHGSESLPKGVVMKRQISAFALVAAIVAGMGSSADAGLFFHRRVVYRPVIVSPVVAPVYVAPIQPVLYTSPPVIYRSAPVVYPSAYYVPARAYYAPVAPVYVGW
jgi:hypothetical protein